MKYIDADKLKAEIERRIGIKENLSQRPEMGDMKESLHDIIGAYKSLKSFITSLQQEQPDGLDEAAEKYAHSLGYDEDKDKAEIAGAKEDFVAGAEWNTGQFEKNRPDALRKIKALRDAQNMHAKTLNYGYRCLAIRLGKEVDEMLDKLKIK